MPPFCTRPWHPWDHWSFQETVQFCEEWWDTYLEGDKTLRNWAREKWGIYNWNEHNSCLHEWLQSHVGMGYAEQPLDLFTMMTTWEATS